MRKDIRVSEIAEREGHSDSYISSAPRSSAPPRRSKPPSSSAPSPQTSASNASSDPASPSTGPSKRRSSGFEEDCPSEGKSPAVIWRPGLVAFATSLTQAHGKSRAPRSTFWEPSQLLPVNSLLILVSTTQRPNRTWRQAPLRRRARMSKMGGGSNHLSARLCHVSQGSHRGIPRCTKPERLR